MSTREHTAHHRTLNLGEKTPQRGAMGARCRDEVTSAARRNGNIEVAGDGRFGSGDVGAQLGGHARRASCWAASGRKAASASSDLRYLVGYLQIGALVALPDVLEERPRRGDLAQSNNPRGALDGVGIPNKFGDLSVDRAPAPEQG